MVVTIYSVLIQNQNTLDSFNEFKELFMDALERKQVDICKWNEAGTDVETVLPDLLELIDEQEAWRAIIILTESELSAFRQNKKAINPFDFQEIQVKGDELRESENPLIRLTQILGGVPVPDVKFESEEIYEENKAPRLVYRPIRQPEQDQKYHELVKKYAYKGKKPEEILIIALREKEDIQREELQSVWDFSTEIDSSEFWKRNGYPSICRFLVYDVANHGKTQEYSDMFRFWMLILLIVMNHINASVIQAYRLYTVKISLNKLLMQEKFQKVAYRLKGAREYVKGEVRRQELEKVNDEKNLPDCSVDIPVEIAMNKGGDWTIDRNEFSTIPITNDGDVHKWNSLEKDMQNRLKDSYRLVERQLDDSAEHARKLKDFPPELVYPLTRYQQEELKEDLESLENTIFEMQKRLPDQKGVVENHLKDMGNHVKKCASLRTDKSSFIKIFLIISCLTLGAIAPGVVLGSSHNVNHLVSMLLFSLVCIGIFLVVEMIEILGQRRDLNHNIGAYNSEIMDSLGDLHKNVEVYSSYISNITTHARTASFLKTMQNDEMRQTDEFVTYQKYLSEIEKLIEKLKKWCVANYIQVDFESEFYEEIVVDQNIKPRQLILYLMQENEKFPVDLNGTGDILESPFNFIDSMEIVREELYEDE